MNGRSESDARGTLRSAPNLIGGFVAALTLWFLALYPLTPSTPIGWCVVVLSGTGCYLWLWASIEALVWLGRRRTRTVISNFIGVCVAASLGVGIFMLSLFGRDFIASHFSYFFR
jgi:hypothetical protein